MRIGSAIYQLSEIQRTSRSARVERERSRPVHDNQDTPGASRPRLSAEQAPSVDRTQPTLAGLLREHFISEVRRRDRDGDGFLNRREYGGVAEDFQRLDRDGDGLIRAQDLIQEALHRSPQLADVVAGRWAPIYNRILNARTGEEDDLVSAIHQGVADVDDAQAPDRQDVAGAGAGHGSEAQPGTPTELFVEFVSEHKDLTGLHQRLQDLADRLGRHQSYPSVDLIA
ncbi:MAG: hypothetical protein GF341_01025 [candidate division Zixibacteria bacterium]|nr:hypothetical protein [candidate division Zixibacteria bacterium]